MVGVITEVGKNVEDFVPGDRCVADNCSSVRYNSHQFWDLFEIENPPEYMTNKCDCFVH